MEQEWKCPQCGHLIGTVNIKLTTVATWPLVVPTRPTRTPPGTPDDHTYTVSAADGPVCAVKS